jgi:alkylated DNA nucleotide flippase Atl1
MTAESVREQILLCVESIPPGRVMTYGDVAEYIGSRAPRQVGRVLSEGHNVPWHRVVHFDGSCTAALSVEQRQRLISEGVRFLGERVDLKTHRWDGQPG